MSVPFGGGSVRRELRRRWWPVLLGVVVAVLLFGRSAASFVTDVLWFDSIGYRSVFVTLLGTRIALGVAAALVAAALVGGNLWLARRLTPPFRIPSPSEEVVERYRQALLPYLRSLLTGVALLLGLVSGLSMVGNWDKLLLWLHRQPFDRVDPYFGRDVAYFVFVLPLQTAVSSWLFGTLVLTLLVTAVAHYLFGGIRPQSPGEKITPQANVHLSVLLAALVAVRAWGYYLDQFLLSYSGRGTVTGLSYTDVNAQLPAYRLLLVIAAACVVLFLVNIRFRGWLLPAAGVGILLVTAVVFAGIFPAVFQRLRVDPQELERERPYITDHLEATRFAFGLDAVDTQPFAANAELSRADVVDNADTLVSLRLWDPVTAQAAYEQLQELRPYYTFTDVDTDRYDVGGELRQVLLGARELVGRDLPEDNWTNRHLIFTHGLGLVASEVSGTSPDGQPVFLVDDIPPSGEPALTPENAGLYFGESQLDYAVVRTRQPETDFVQEQGGVAETRYAGADGVGVGSLLRRLLFAMRFAEANFVLSDLIVEESRVLFRRDVAGRVAAVAPFLKLDQDPYPVAADGRVKWIVDAYTTSDMVPYSQRVDLGELTSTERTRLVSSTEGAAAIVAERRALLPGIEGRANYIRNSVKAVVDAYDGTVSLYVVDPDDPVIAAWRAAFPAAFSDVAEASAELTAHFRYPEDLFRVQSAVYGRYHIEGPDAFYTSEDAWQIPTDPSYDNNQLALPVEQRQARQLRPTYQLLRLPGEDEPQFALVLPFTPVGRDRDNLIAYLAGRSVPGETGRLKVFRMPSNKTVLGPRQVQANINSDPEISTQRTLLDQRGSSVIFGNLLTIPIEDSLLYAQPLFLQAEETRIPELRKVVLAFADRIVISDTLAEALRALFGVAPEAVRSPADEEPPAGGGDDGERPPSGASDPQVRRLIGEALDAFAGAEQALRDGDLGRYQELTEEAQQRLADAQRLLGGATPQPAPTPTEGG
ncbi:MAG: UPF0182 family protein [Euzebyales bacterium]|nr:UPF0182 family protein [Euzebyales bacterium]